MTNDMIDDIIKFTSQYFGLEDDSILSDSRKDKVCLAKHICIFYLHRDCKVSISKIAKRFNRKPWMIFYAVRKIEGWLCYDGDFKNKYFAFKEELDSFLKKD